MAGSRFCLASIWTALLALVLLSQHVHASSAQQKRDDLGDLGDMGDLGPMAPDTPEVMAVTNQANAKPSLEMAPDVAMQKIHDKYMQNIEKNMTGSCTKENIAVRKEWSDLTPEMRKSFISACHCMAHLPAQSSKSWAPGARNRWDDFVAGHIRIWRDIHFSVWNTIWHRQMVWIMEQALRQECGYDGWMPFFDWSRYLDGPPEKNPLFDGSDTSISGDGDHRSNDCSYVTSGPFKNWTVNLGPVPGTTTCTQNPLENGLGYNPRPLERAFDSSQMQNMTYEKVAETIMNVESMQEWVLRIEARGIGLHAMPHQFMGGLQANIPASAGDCWFYMHHCMLDRMWSFWQMQDPEHRLFQIPTDQHEFDPFRTRWAPPPPLSLDAIIHVSDVFEDVPVRNVMSTTQHQLCYMYE